MCYENSFPTVYYNYRNYTNLAPLKIQQKRVKLFIRTISDDLHPIQEDGTREFDTLKSKKVPQSLEIGLFFCQIFIFII